MTHLTRDELVDALEGTLEPGRRSHLDACVICRREATGLAAILDDARAVEVPEPSPLFWDHLSGRVREAIAGEPPRGSVSRSLSWPVLAPFAALSVMVFALVSAVPRHVPPERAPVVAADALAADPSALDATWVLVSDLVGSVDVDEAQDAGIETLPGSAERVALHLSASEQLELVRLLREELGRSGG